jgi:hypothetical protein
MSFLQGLELAEPAKYGRDAKSHSLGKIDCSEEAFKGAPIQRHGNEPPFAAKYLFNGGGSKRGTPTTACSLQTIRVGDPLREASILRGAGKRRCMFPCPA